MNWNLFFEVIYMNFFPIMITLGECSKLRNYLLQVVPNKLLSGWGLVLRLIKRSKASFAFNYGKFHSGQSEFF